MRPKYIKNSQFICTFGCLSVLFLDIVFLSFSHFLVTKYKTEKGVKVCMLFVKDSANLYENLSVLMPIISQKLNRYISQ